MKHCELSLIQPLLLLFIKYIFRGIMTSSWKKSFFTAIFKHSSKHEIINYRPVLEMGSITKLFDKIITNRFTDFFIANVFEEQHGFVFGCPY